LTAIIVGTAVAIGRGSSQGDANDENNKWVALDSTHVKAHLAAHLGKARGVSWPAICPMLEGGRNGTDRGRPDMCPFFQASSDRVERACAVRFAASVLRVDRSFDLGDEFSVTERDDRHRSFAVRNQRADFRIQAIAVADTSLDIAFARIAVCCGLPQPFASSDDAGCGGAGAAARLWVGPQLQRRGERW
jgi:hypothetical protein